MSVPARVLWATLLTLGLVTGLAQAQDAPLGKPAAFGILDAGTSITVPAGAALRSQPDPKSARLITIATEVELQVLERRGDWVRTAYGDWIGWLAPLGEEASEIPLPKEIPASLLVVDTRLLEQAERLSRARQLLDGINSDFTSVGPWPLHTDVTDAELLALLDRVARQVPALYAERFGLPPATSQPSAVVLFAREESYRLFASQDSDISEIAGGGHADSTMAALFVNDEASPAGVASVLVHELTHLLNRAHFAVAPSTWLEEGMASELGFTRIDPKGRLELGSLGGTSWMMAQRTSRGRTEITGTLSGGVSAWTQLVRAWRDHRSTLTPLDRLLDLSWTEFVEESQRTSNYSLAIFFLRYLLDEVEEGTTVAFRDFLSGATKDGVTDGAALARALDTTPEALKHDFEHWLTVEVVAHR